MHYSHLSPHVSRDAVKLLDGGPVLFRQQRRARLDRLQAVDVVQPLFARLAGLARITLEVAGGSGSAVTLSYLTETQATSLRNHLLARAGPELLLFDDGGALWRWRPSDTVGGGVSME